MKKIRYCLYVTSLFYLLQQAVQAQSTQYKIDSYFHIGKTNGTICPNNDGRYYYDFFIADKDGVKRRSYYRNISGKSDWEDYTDSRLIITTTSARLRHIHYNSYARIRQWNGNCGGAMDETELNVYIPEDDDFYYERRTSFHNGSVYASSEYRVDIEPVIKIFSSPYSSTFSNKSPLFISASEGFSAKTYRWQLRDTDGIWENLPVPYGNSSFYVHWNTFFNNNIDNFLRRVGKTISFRIKYDRPGHPNGDFIIYDAENYQLRVQTPDLITKDYKYYNTSCWNTNDGRVILPLDRRLFDGETYHVSYTNPTTMTPVNITFRNTDQDADNMLTIRNLPKGTYTFTVMGKYTNQSGIFDNTRTYSSPIAYINAPIPLTISATKLDVNCKGGADGQLIPSISGGTPPYSYYFKTSHYTQKSSNQKTDTLPAGTYEYWAEDAKGCITNRITPPSVFISEPSIAVYLADSNIRFPGFFGAKEGKIKAAVNGGTPPYTFEWRDASNNLLRSTENPALSFDSISGLESGYYTLTVKDKHYNCSNPEARNCKSCYLKLSFYLPQPPDIDIILTQTDSLACYGDSLAIIKTHVSGGTPFDPQQNNGELFQYQWFKQNLQTSLFEKLENETFHSLSNGTAGIYKIRVTDASNYTKLSDSMIITQPDSLQLAFKTIAVTCGDDSSGSAQVIINGGVLPYHIQWSSAKNPAFSETTELIDKLTMGEYPVLVEDDKGCLIYGTVKIKENNQISITSTKTPPVCKDDCTGSISLNATGGTPPYQYLWENKDWKNKQDLKDLCPGNYPVHIKDARDCNVYDTLKVPQAAAVSISFPDRIVLCKNQTYTANPGSFVTYSWKREEDKSPCSFDKTLVLNKKGKYTLTVMNTDFCTKTHFFEVIQSNKEVISDFLAATHTAVGTRLVLVNISYPEAADYEWVLPEESCKVLSRNSTNTQFYFTDTGTFSIGLIAKEGGCELYSEKQIRVFADGFAEQPEEWTGPFIKEFSVFPNPSSGHFTIKVELDKKTPIRIRMLRLNDAFMVEEWKKNNSDLYMIEYQNKIPYGTYLLVLDTEQNTQILKIVIAR